MSQIVFFQVKTIRTQEIVRNDQFIYDDPIRAQALYDTLKSGALQRLKSSFDCKLTYKDTESGEAHEIKA